MRHDVKDRPPFIFCESVYASGSSPWHIRPVGQAGLKPGGGIDTPSLCERVKPAMGWDLLVKINDLHLDHACRACVAKYREQVK